MQRMFNYANIVGVLRSGDAMVLIEEIYKAVLGYFRYRQKKWLRNLAVELEAAETGTAE